MLHCVSLLPSLCIETGKLELKMKLQNMFLWPSVFSVMSTPPPTPSLFHHGTALAVAGGQACQSMGACLARMASRSSRRRSFDS